MSENLIEKELKKAKNEIDLLINDVINDSNINLEKINKVINDIERIFIAQTINETPEGSEHKLDDLKSYLKEKIAFNVKNTNIQELTVLLSFTDLKRNVKSEYEKELILTDLRSELIDASVEKIEISNAVNVFMAILTGKIKIDLEIGVNKFIDKLLSEPNSQRDIHNNKAVNPEIIINLDYFNECLKKIYTLEEILKMYDDNIDFLEDMHKIALIKYIAMYLKTDDIKDIDIARNLLLKLRTIKLNKFDIINYDQCINLINEKYSYTERKLNYYQHVTNDVPWTESPQQEVLDNLKKFVSVLATLNNENHNLSYDVTMIDEDVYKGLCYGLSLAFLNAETEPLGLMNDYNSFAQVTEKQFEDLKIRAAENKLTDVDKDFIRRYDVFFQKILERHSTHKVIVGANKENKDNVIRKIDFMPRKNQFRDKVLNYLPVNFKYQDMLTINNLSAVGIDYNFILKIDDIPNSNYKSFLLNGNNHAIAIRKIGNKDYLVYDPNNKHPITVHVKDLKQVVMEMLKCEKEDIDSINVAGINFTNENIPDDSDLKLDETEIDWAKVYVKLLTNSHILSHMHENKESGIFLKASKDAQFDILRFLFKNPYIANDVDLINQAIEICSKMAKSESKEDKKKFNEIVYLCVSEYKNFERQENDNLLSQAITSGKYSDALKLIKGLSNSALNQSNELDFSPLMVAAAKYSMVDDNEKEKIVEIICALLDKNVDILFTNRYSYNFDNMLLDTGLIYEHKIVEALTNKYFLNKGYLQNFEKEHDGKNLLHLLLENNMHNVHENIYVNDAFIELINKTDNDGNSPLKYLNFNVTNERKSQTLLLLNKGAKYIENNKELQTRLHIALHCLIDNEKPENIKLFENILNNNINVINQLDDKGMTVLDYAQQYFIQGRKGKKIITLLENNGAQNSKNLNTSFNGKTYDKDGGRSEIEKKSILYSLPSNLRLDGSLGDFISWIENNKELSWKVIKKENLFLIIDIKNNNKRIFSLSKTADQWRIAHSGNLAAWMIMFHYAIKTKETQVHVSFDNKVHKNAEEMDDEAKNFVDALKHTLAEMPEETKKIFFDIKDDTTKDAIFKHLVKHSDNDKVCNLFGFLINESGLITRHSNNTMFKKQIDDFNLHLKNNKVRL